MKNQTWETSPHVYDLDFLTIQLSFKCVLLTFLLLFLSSILLFLSTFFKSYPASICIQTSYVRVSVSSWKVFIGSLSTIFLPADSLYLRVNYECPSHMAFFIHESLAFWTNLNSIMFWLFIVRFNQSFWLKLYFVRLFFFGDNVLVSCFPFVHLWVLEL